MNKRLVSCLKYNGTRFFGTSSNLCKKGGGAAAAGTGTTKSTAFKAKTVVEEPEPVRDTKLLVSKCCGANKYLDQEDPDIKPDDQYPDWLWSIHTGKSKMYYECDPNTKEYWSKLFRMRRYQRTLPRKGAKFYYAPRSHEISFQSRLLDSSHPSPQTESEVPVVEFEISLRDRLPLRNPNQRNS